MSAPKIIMAFAVALLIATCSVLWSSSKKKAERYRDIADFELPFNASPSGVRSVRVISWLSSGRARSILITEMTPSESLVTEFLNKDAISNLIDARCGWGASALKQLAPLISAGGFVVRKKSGELVGFSDKQKMLIVIPASYERQL